MKHVLKTWPKWFERVVEGRKTFEVRVNDRDYQAGDHVELHEYDPKEKTFSGRYIKARIGYVYSGDNLDCGYCVFSLLKAEVGTLTKGDL